jgi:hypothetical protein
MSQNAQLLFMGLPGSGKTTFLAAFWHVLSERMDSTKLQLTKTSGDRSYLNAISREWRDCNQVSRTALGTEEVVILHLTNPSDIEYDLVIPDLSGEVFDQLIADRRISIEYNKMVKESTGIILFVNSDVQKGQQLTHAVRLAASIGGSLEEGVPNSEQAQVWSVEMLPTQIKLVELGQLILEQTEHKIKIALIISAWDLVDHLGSPELYLQKHIPLLHQFLETNDDMIEVAVFGISAQGGDITIPEEKTSLLNLEDAANRIKVRKGDETTNDITKPVAWLLESK